VRKQDGMHLICFHFGFQIHTTRFSLEDSGIFLEMVEKCSFMCSKRLGLAHPSQWLLSLGTPLPWPPGVLQIQGLAGRDPGASDGRPCLQLIIRVLG